MVDVFIFESEMWERDYADNFTTNEIFPTHDALFERVWGTSFHLGFVVMIIRSNKVNGQPMRKTYVLLGCERGWKVQEI